MQQRLGPPRPLGAAQVPQAPDPVTEMLTATVAPLITDDRIREAEAHRIARTARSQRTRNAGARRLGRPSWPSILPRTGATPR